VETKIILVSGSKVSYGAETFGPGLGSFSIILTALNKGHQPVTLSNAGIQLPDGRQVAYLGESGSTRFPHELAGGKSCFICMPFHVLAEQLKSAGFSKTIKVTGYFRDALDKRYTSKSFDFDFDTDAQTR
jgi:hypothetical protein